MPHKSVNATIPTVSTALRGTNAVTSPLPEFEHSPPAPASKSFANTSGVFAMEEAGIELFSLTSSRLDKKWLIHANIHGQAFHFSALKVAACG